MKILLDENIDVRFKLHFPDSYEVLTVKDMNWNGIKNGCLRKIGKMFILKLLKKVAYRYASTRV